MFGGPNTNSDEISPPVQYMEMKVQEIEEIKNIQSLESNSDILDEMRQIEEVATGGQGKRKAEGLMSETYTNENIKV
jgi:hypothetical protein